MHRVEMIATLEPTLFIFNIYSYSYSFFQEIDDLFVIIQHFQILCSGILYL
jgi:hypothetical protein